jgi:hypothetical protein
MKSKKPADKPKDGNTQLAEKLMKDYDREKQGEIDRQGLADLLQDAYKLANKRMRVSKEDLDTLMHMLDKDGDGRVTMSDLEATVGKIMLKKKKEEEERVLEAKKRDEDRKMMFSPIRDKSPKPAAKEKEKSPIKATEKPSKTKEVTPPKAETKEKKSKKDKEEKEPKEEKPKKEKDKSTDKPKKEEKKEEKKKSKK